jgi:hypothetical protein
MGRSVGWSASRFTIGKFEDKTPARERSSNSLRPRKGARLLWRPSDLKVIGNKAASLKVLQPSISPRNIRDSIPVRSRGASDAFLSAFCRAWSAINLDGDIQILGCVVEALSGPLRIVTKELKNAFRIHQKISSVADILTLSAHPVPAN